MPKNKFYKVNTIRQKNPAKWGLFSHIGKNKRHKKLLASVIGVYLLVGVGVGYILFSSNNRPAKAGESAYVSSSIKFVEEKIYKVGDQVKIGITLQNTSITEPINNLSLDLYSTKESVKWTDVRNKSDDNQVLSTAQNNNFKLPLLSSAQRAEYTLQGTLQDDQMDYLTILGKVRYLNKDGVQEIETNKVSTQLNSQTNTSSTLLSLKTNKDTFLQGDEISLDVEKKTEDKIRGKIFITNKDTQEPVNSLECVLSNTTSCSNNLKNLDVGQYSAMFIDETEKYYSNIVVFQVTGKKPILTPNSQTTLDFTFGSSSINGLVSVVAKKVISLNQSIDSSMECSFEITLNGAKISNAKSKVDSDRSCKILLNSDQFTKGNGVYKIKLVNSSLEKEVSYTAKSPNLITLTNKTARPTKDQSVEIEATGLVDTNNNVLNDKKISLFLWQTTTSSFKEITSINGSDIKIMNGLFNIKIPPSYLNQGSMYMAMIKIEDGQQSDWIGLNFEDKQIGFSGSGVIFDDKKMYVGESINFTLESLMDKNGNIINEGECSANIYTMTNVSTAITVKGQIKNGTCSAVLPDRKVTKSGPALISFTGPEISNKINQSRQFNFLPAKPEKIGKLSLEFEPARSDFANNLIIGPTTDKYGNLVNIFNYKLEVLSGIEVLQEFNNIQIQSGFAKIPIPSTIFKNQDIIFKLKNEKGEEVSSRSVTVQNTNDKLTLPNFPSTVMSDQNIEVSMLGLTEANKNECNLEFYKSQDEFAQETALINTEQGKCEFNWNLNKLRSNKKALLQLKYRDSIFSQIVDLTSSDPSNLFVVAPQVRINNVGELNINLLSSPIVDKQGLLIEKNDMKWQYNGKVVETKIIGGLSNLDLPANKLESKDIQTNNNIKYLELDIDVKAGIGSISKTNNLSVFLGDKGISNIKPEFEVIKASNQLENGKNSIFQFRTNLCKVKLINSNKPNSTLNTHWQGGVCHVEVVGITGKNSIVFEDKGFVLGKYEYVGQPKSQEIIWCSDESSGCLIKVLAPINSAVQAIVYDGDKQYKFVGDDLENNVKISQNGLNPLKKYLVEIRYKDTENIDVSQIREITGQTILK